MTQTHAAAVHDFQDLGPASVPWSQSHRLASKTIGQDYLIEVAWPLGPIAAREQLPVIYVLDGNYAFSLTAAIARMLQSGPFPLPRTLVVGVGYHFEKPEDHRRWGLLRARDLTPGPDALYEAQARGAPTPHGGAADFLGFIETELKPFIAERYPVDAQDQTLIGSSLGGLFALYALFTRPAAFQRCVAISPAIYWGGRTLFDLEAELAAGAGDLPVNLFLAAGGLEEAHDAEQRFVSNVYELDARLRRRNYPSLKAAMQIFEGETHMSVFPGAVTRGIGQVFGGYRDMHDWSRWLDLMAAARA